ncbi:hypothetical protein C5Y96_07830 [Blastopirellula marina]|uniref:Cytochrome c domain-containing protein n=1 Tax=Blastopirellula marina TaxID=124 RepID=A0A2S8FY02_9BACT|nr:MULTISPECIES: hypothetical protein [Pirellulaceae]PQO37059.1 hypothetical protein C5Y96_07830 [Blastopirellula marina]RCS53774.1 hypothetical protein DTL36_07840 [Bremerella cremea]
MFARIVLSACFALVGVSYIAQPAHAIPFFWEVFNEKVVPADPKEEPAKQFAATATGSKCNVCHIDGQSKKERNAYGAALDELLDKANFSKERLEKEKDKATEEVVAALEKVKTMKVNKENEKSPTFADNITAGKLPAEIAKAEPMPDPMPMPEPMPAETTAEPAAGLVLDAAALDKLKADIRKEVKAELSTQLRKGMADAIKTQLQVIEIVKAHPLAPVDDATEEETIKQIVARGGRVNVLAQNSDEKVVSFHLSDKPIDDEALALVRKLRNVVEINARGTNITDEGIKQLVGLPNLQRLNLAKTGVTDAALIYLVPHAKLEYLNLYGTKVTDQGIDVLANLTNLKHLYLWQTGASQEGADALESQLTGLKVNLGS